ncbi:helix-turn-helix domain-containing protein [Kitasatospora cineracea]|uniref:helix-turn-helix domain-containing protein n=1 Tax=Kitasatospora cineracea TaxID=88074 RepID=UPI003678244E
MASPTRTGPAGDHLGRAVASARAGRGWDQAELARRLSAAGMPTGQPVLSRIEQGARRVDVDELVTLAAVLGIAPADLLPPQHSGAPALLPSGLAADAEAGTVEAALADDLEHLGDLTGMEPTLAATAVRLARQIDGGRPVACEECGTPVRTPADSRALPQLARELRATVAALLEGRAVDDDDDDDLDDLGSV